MQPWQEASIGAEVNGLKLAEVLVNVGDVVKQGQLLARLSDETVRADVAAQRASLAEAEASLENSSSSFLALKAYIPEDFKGRGEVRSR